MTSIKKIFQEQFFARLNEDLIVLGGKPYPRFGQVVIMAGGAGSGKGFIKDKLVGVEGRVYDVDALKSLATRAPKIIQRVKDELGIDLSQYDSTKNKTALKDPETVKKLHEIIGNHLVLDLKRRDQVFNSAFTAPPERKPNIIFDVTMKNMKNLYKYAGEMQNLGYDPKNIHIVWVVNKLEIALDQNLKRNRVVPKDIFLATHEGASMTMRNILQMGDDARKYFDGDFVLAFNQANVDAQIEKSGRGGSHIKKGSANYVYVKRSGKGIDASKLSNDVKRKINDYVPDNVSWEVDF